MIGRNDPCPCGSGKKYKQCCLLKQSGDQTQQAKERHFFERKFKLTTDLYSFLAQKQGGEWNFDHQKYKPFNSSLGDYREGAGNMWAYFFRVYDNGLRGIEWFVKERGQRYSGEDRKMLENWKEMKVSCYQLVDQYEQGAVIEDIWSKERYRMPYCETMIKLPPWAVSVGMIEPYIEDWCIHGVFMWGHPEVASEVMTRIVEQLQEETAEASEQEMSPAGILAGNYPEILDLCNRINSRNEKPVSNLKDMGEQIFVTHEYTCEFPDLLEEMLLNIGDEYILAPGTDPAEGTILINRVDKLDGILGTIPADRQEQLGLDEIHISRDFGNIRIDKQGVTVSGWQSAELEATLELLESKSTAIGLTRVNERRETNQLPKELVIKGYNIITDKNLSDQEVNAYGNLPILLQWYRDTQEKNPAESAEMLVRRREYEQYRINADASNLNLLRVALGLPESPFTG